MRTWDSTNFCFVITHVESQALAGRNLPARDGILVRGYQRSIFMRITEVRILERAEPPGCIDRQLQASLKLGDQFVSCWKSARDRSRPRPR